jgi:UPF0271 protein
MGEGIPNDAALMPFISSANIACGFHAGNHTIMQQTVELCLQHKVTIGAHPGFNDIENFGRIDLIGSSINSNQVTDLVTEQLTILQKICTTNGTSLKHVKPHGALYNRAAVDATVSSAICLAIQQFNPNLLFYGLSGSIMEQAAQQHNLTFISEVFADRTYQPNGTLTPRNQPNALITKTQHSIAQAMQMVQHNTVNDIQGNSILIKAQTICLHGDGAHAVPFAQSIYQTLKENHIDIKAPC